MSNKGTLNAGGMDMDGIRLAVLRVPLPVSASSGVEIDLGKKLPAKCVVTNVFVDVVVAASSVSVLFDLGTLSTASGGDADGFLAGLNYGTAGVTQGSIATASRTLGALFQAVSGGSTNDLSPVPAVLDISRSVSFTPRAALNNLNAKACIVYFKL